MKLEIDKQVVELDPSYFGHIYGIRSINFPYALLLLKLVNGAEIKIVTHPPEDELYQKQKRTEEIRNLLDFLDEIGCQIFLNDRIHTKLILSNDLALIGSMNLSKTALYDEGQEEIAVSMDDLGNLNILENYAKNLASSSKPYGYTLYVHRPIEKITRGWLYTKLIEHFFEIDLSYETNIRVREMFWVFLNDQNIDKRLDFLVKEVAIDLEYFYYKAVSKFLVPPMSLRTASDERLSLLSTELGYQGRFEYDDMLEFITTKFVRRHIPNVPLMIKSMEEKE